MRAKPIHPIRRCPAQSTSTPEIDAWTSHAGRGNIDPRSAVFQSAGSKPTNILPPPEIVAGGSARAACLFRAARLISTAGHRNGRTACVRIGLGPTFGQLSSVLGKFPACAVVEARVRAREPISGQALSGRGRIARRCGWKSATFFQRDRGASVSYLIGTGHRPQFHQIPYRPTGRRRKIPPVRITSRASEGTPRQQTRSRTLPPK
jgi:hypothetical protein